MKCGEVVVNGKTNARRTIDSVSVPAKRTRALRLVRRSEFCVGLAAATMSVTAPSRLLPNSKKRLRAVELFAGVGGFRLACDSLGIETIWANDINENAVRVYRDRFGGDAIVCGDVNGLIDAVPAHDLLTGGFPCQPFSRAGKKLGIEDYRGTLFESIVKILKAKGPEYFILENVNSLLFLEDGKNFKTILYALDELGYKLEWRVFNAAGFGLPQHRLRVIISGRKHGKSNESVFLTNNDLKDISEKTNERIARYDLWQDVADAKGKFKQWGMACGGKFISVDFQPLRNLLRERKLKDILQAEVPPEFDFTEDTLKRIEKSQFVNRFYNEVRILYNQGGGARMGYTIFGADGLSPTLTASTSRHYERYGIDGRFRRLTNVEYARLQGFPDDHCSSVSVYEQYRLYGNAVPPPLVRYAIKRVVEDDVVILKSHEHQLSR